MDEKYNAKVNKALSEILNIFVGEMNSQETRDKIAYKLKCFLESQAIKYETINTYTPPERVDKGFVDIRVDEELYPFAEISEINSNNWHDYILKFDESALRFKDTVKLFQYLIDDGCVWNLEGFYRRTAEDLIRGGYCTLSHKETRGCYMWGSPILPKKFDLEPGLPGTDEYVQKRKELGDDEFFEWSNLKITEVDE